MFAPFIIRAKLAIHQLIIWGKLW